MFRSTSLVMMPPRVSMPRDKRRHVQQQHVLHFAGQHAALDRRADGHDLVGVDALVRLLAEHAPDQLLHLGDPRRAAHQHHFVDFAGVRCASFIAWLTGPRQRSIR